MSLDAAQDSSDTQASDALIAERDAAWVSERAALRARIEAAVEAAGVHPIARRTLALLIEAEIESLAGGDAAPARPEGEARAPSEVDDALARMRAGHPGLFRSPEPEPEASPAAAPEPAGRTDGAMGRLWSRRSHRARDIAAAAGGLGGALVAAVGTGWGRAKTNRTGRPADTASPDGPSPKTASAITASPNAAVVAVAAESAVLTPPALDPSLPKPSRQPGQAAAFARRLRQDAGDLWVRALDQARRARDGVQDAVGAGGILRRPSAVAALAGLVLVGAVALAIRQDGQREASPPASASPPPVTPPLAAPAPPVATTPPPQAPVQAETSAPSPAPLRPPPDEEPAPDDAPMQAEISPQAGEISGPAEVIDTATIKVGGRVVRLFGVVWVRGGQADELARYLGKRPVTCRPVAGSDAHLCAVDGRDLSEVVLFNGGGRASPEATPDLVAAEDRARTERLGVWAR